MQEEWTDWIEHDGKGCPLQAGMLVEITERAIEDGPAWAAGDEKSAVVVLKKPAPASWDWTDEWRNADVIRYRIRKPRALSQLRELVENLPERETTDA